MMTCKVCDKKFHNCSSCDYYGQEYLSSGYCSITCYRKSERFQEVKSVIDRIKSKVDKEDLENLLFSFEEFEVGDHFD